MFRAADTISGLTGWPRRIAALAAGAASVLAFAPFHLWYVLFLTLTLFVWLIDGGCQRADDWRGRVRAAARTGWFFGFGFFLAGLHWVGNSFLVEGEVFAWLMPLAIAGLPAGLAIFFAAGAGLASLVWRPGLSRLFALTLALSLAELARGSILTGLPWNTLGYALTTNDAMMQWASVFGVYALTLIAVALFIVPAALLEPGCEGQKVPASARAYALVMLAVLAGGWAWGSARLENAQTSSPTGVRLRVVQPNIPQSEKWKPENAAAIFQEYLRLSRRGPESAPAPLDSATHLVWPESALPFLLADTTEALAAIAELLPEGTMLLTGQARAHDELRRDGSLKRRHVYNSLFVMNDRARILALYDKLHLVPFGEYLPFQDALESIGLEQLTRVKGGFTPGNGKRFLAPERTPPFVPLICYEVIFPHQIRPRDTSPQWLLNVTNDAWFGASAGPYQHFHQARVRAVEQGLPLVRAANTGISAVINSYGEILVSLPLGARDVFDAVLPAPIEPTIFVKKGRFIELFCIYLLVCGLDGTFPQINFGTIWPIGEYQIELASPTAHALNCQWVDNKKIIQ